jgi:hypothetical protein
VAHAPDEPHPPCADLSAVEARYLLAIFDLARAALVLSSRRAAAHTLVHDLLGVDDQLSRAEADLLATSVSPALGRRLHAGRGRPPRASDAQTNRPSPT